MNRVSVMNRTRERLLGMRVGLADSWWLRLRGLLGRPELEPGEGLLLVPCSAVHTYGMKYPLDVLLLTRRGTVLATFPELAPWGRTPRLSDARYALELPAGTIEATGTRPGDRLAWFASGMRVLRDEPSLDLETLHAPDLPVPIDHADRPS